MTDYGAKIYYIVWVSQGATEVMLFDGLEDKDKSIKTIEKDGGKIIKHGFEYLNADEL